MNTSASSSFSKAMIAIEGDIIEKWTAFYIEHKRIKPVRITRRVK